ncbi:hypothetical protein L1987_81960 [Smallanthus sonchifolius]|uniref:Uncharacterized protein n=1 Tax=Smallanthus sonchifolius TaxID=185202 RepID=A0ACB8YSB2_9ASTR|nr:hypothetical protein L1987_81960 [Smallanthus sonchifolius]
MEGDGCDVAGRADDNARSDRTMPEGNPNWLTMSYMVGIAEIEAASASRATRRRDIWEDAMLIHSFVSCEDLNKLRVNI